jgi:hypothetical protein
MKAWFFATWSGDIRLLKDPDNENACVLTVENPTQKEWKDLNMLFEVLRERHVLDAAVGLVREGKSIVKIPLPNTEIGPLLAKELLDGVSTWTALRSENGKITVIDGTEIDEKAKETAVAAATVTPPTAGCPEPESCSRRASEVLRAFSTERQYKEFLRTGSMPCIGNRTGRAYRVFHRDEAARRGMQHTLFDISQNRQICQWNASVPAEEEVLSLKLAVEHREQVILGSNFPRL